jgi:hypothetical protein
MFTGDNIYLALSRLNLSEYAQGRRDREVLGVH